MNQMSVSPRKKSHNINKENFSPSKSPYGLVKVEDVLAEDIQKKISTDSQPQSPHSNIIAFLMGDSHAPTVTICPLGRPIFKAETVINDNGTSFLEIQKSVTISSNAKNALVRNKDNIVETNTLGEKIKKLDSTPPAKNEYVKPSVKIPSDKGAPQDSKSDFSAKGFASSLPPKLESAIKPDFSNFSTAKPNVEFQSLASTPPKVNFSNETVLHSTDSKNKEIFDSKDDSENPFLVISKTKDTSTTNHVIPEQKGLISTSKIPVFIPSPVGNISSSGIAAGSVDNKTLVNQDSKYDEIKGPNTEGNSGSDNIKPEVSKFVADEDEINSESSSESGETGELVNEDDDLNQSEIDVEKLGDEKQPSLDALDFFGAAKPKNIVNPMFTLNDKISESLGNYIIFN